MEYAGVRVLIVDDHNLFSEVMRSTLEALEMQVVGVSMTAAEGLDMARSLRPSLVLLDLGLPDGSGLAVGREILADQPDVKVVAVTANRDPRSLREAVRAGFAGYITKDTPVRQFVSSIRAALDGQVVMPRHLARQASGVRSPEEQQAALLIDQMTSREREVLQLLSQGASSSEIARRLCVSRNTVRTHVQNILSKLQVHSRLEAAAFAVRHGLVRTGTA